LTALEKEPIRVIRTLKSFKISRVPEEQKAKAKKFKEHQLGFLHYNELKADLRRFLIW